MMFEKCENKNFLVIGASWLMICLDSRQTPSRKLCEKMSRMLMQRLHLYDKSFFKTEPNSGKKN